MRHDEDGDKKKSAVSSEVHWHERETATAGIGDEQGGQGGEEEIRADELTDAQEKTISVMQVYYIIT